MNVNLTKSIRVASAQESGWLVIPSELDFQPQFVDLSFNCLKGACMIFFSMCLHTLCYISFIINQLWAVWGHSLKTTAFISLKILYLTRQIE